MSSRKGVKLCAFESALRRQRWPASVRTSESPSARAVSFTIRAPRGLCLGGPMGMGAGFSRSWRMPPRTAHWAMRSWSTNRAVKTNLGPCLVGATR